MTLASGTAWRKIVGTGPWRRGHPFGVLDIGSSKLCCYIARPRPGQGVQLLGRGYQVAEGLKGGDVVDAEAAEAAILGALHEAEQQAGETLREICAGGERRARAVELCPGRLRAARPRRHRGRPAAPARPRAPRGHHARARGAACGAGRDDDRRRASAQGRLRPVRAAPRDRGASGHGFRHGPAQPAGLPRALPHRGQGRGVGELRRGHRLPCRGRAGARLPGPRLRRRHHRYRALRRWPADAGGPGPLWRRPHHRRSRLRPVDQPPACRADQEPVRRHAVSQLRRGHAHRAAAARATMPSCPPARCRAPGSPRSCAPGSRRSWLWPGAAWTSIASCWRPGRRAPSCSPAAAASSRGSRSWSRRCSACRPAVPDPVPWSGTRQDEPCCATAAGAVALVLGDDGGLGWRDQIEVSVLSHRLARLGQWFRENF